MENSTISTHHSEKKKGCKNCGAELTYKPGSEFIICEYCGNKEIIKTEEGSSFQELDLLPYLEKLGAQSHSLEISMIQCKKCGANQHIEENYKSLHCVYCSTPLLIEDSTTEEWILPGAILPFQINKNESHEIFAKWVKGLWFAPNKLKKAILDIQNTKGLYLPYWTFDAQLYGTYRGEKGEYYYVNVNHTRRKNGKVFNETRRERRTRWYPANGTIKGFIDDTLVKASYQQKNKIPKKVEHWNLKELKTFKSDYLSGFITEKYTIPLKNGHLESIEEAKKIADIWAKRDIGGDTQKLYSVDFELTKETFKHILLPVYISSYKYNGKSYQFFVNGQTGTIHGKRPYSAIKIALAVILGLIIVTIIAFIASSH